MSSGKHREGSRVERCIHSSLATSFKLGVVSVSTMHTFGGTFLGVVGDAYDRLIYSSHTLT